MLYCTTFRTALRTTLRTTFALLLSTAGFTSAHAEGPAVAPISAFFAHASYSDAELSPNGKYLAVRVIDKAGHDAMAVITLDTLAASIAAGFADDDIGAFQWVNNERLVYTLHDKRSAQGDLRVAQGLYAVNRDGTKSVQLAERTAPMLRESSMISRKTLPWHTYMMAPGAQDSDAIYVASPETGDRGYGNNLEYVNLLRLDTVTGRSEVVRRPGAVHNWMLDQKGEPRLATAVEHGTETIWYRDPATDAWRTLATFDVYGEQRDSFQPIGFGPDGALYVTVTGPGGTTGLHRFNFTTGKADPDALVDAPGYDFNGALVRNRNKLLGVTMKTDTHTSAWFDPAMQAMQKKVDQALPGMINMLMPAVEPGATNVLVESFSDRVPLRYSLFNSQTGQLNPIGNSQRAIDPAVMGRQEMVRYKARDGLTIPALLTLPPGGAHKNLPMVVLVHGGPYVDGPTWGWNRESQFLATRGYAVLEPHFRGTTGLGHKHFTAGFKQWGLAMQDDIADGAQWAIAKGYADANRVCIAGASYGGYAVLMGLVNDPTLYKCGVEWVGVTDINLMYTDTWNSESDASDEWKKYGMPRLVGDRVKDAAQLKATSPIEQAARITQPLLLAYGGADRRVPMAQGKLFYEKVQQTNKNVEWIQYDSEGHGWYLPKNNIDFWTRVEKFLNKNIGPGQQRE
jgi:acetyl esterase/lipase